MVISDIESLPDGVKKFSLTRDNLIAKKIFPDNYILGQPVIEDIKVLESEEVKEIELEIPEAKILSILGTPKSLLKGV